VQDGDVMRKYLSLVISDCRVDPVSKLVEQSSIRDPGEIATEVMATTNIQKFSPTYPKTSKKLPAPDARIMTDVRARLGRSALTIMVNVRAIADLAIAQPSHTKVMHYTARCTLVAQDTSDDSTIEVDSGTIMYDKRSAPTTDTRHDSVPVSALSLRVFQEAFEGEDTSTCSATWHWRAHAVEIALAVIVVVLIMAKNRAS
jgi:hypothetical protein